MISTTIGQHAVAAMAGFPAPKARVRRGGGRHKGPAAPSPTAAPGSSPSTAAHDQHKNALDCALSSGDHAAASNHALNLANALKRLAGRAGNTTGPKGAVPSSATSMTPAGNIADGM